MKWKIWWLWWNTVDHEQNKNQNNLAYLDINFPENDDGSKVTIRVKNHDVCHRSVCKHPRYSSVRFDTVKTNCGEAWPDNNGDRPIQHPQKLQPTWWKPKLTSAWLCTIEQRRRDLCGFNVNYLSGLLLSAEGTPRARPRPFENPV